MFKRHKIILGILLEAPKVPTRTELMKWLFLLRQETCLSSESSFYDFIPYKYGPFSFMVYRDLEELARYGYLKGESYELSPSMTKEARDIFETLPGPTQEAVRNVVRSYGRHSRNELVNYIYEKYSWFSPPGNSTKHDRSSSPINAVYTAGYEGRSIDSFLKELLSAGIQRLIDVRRNPISRKYGFSKNTLGRLCEKLNIEYVHVPELGIPSSYRTELHSFDDYQKLMRKYERFFLPKVPDVRRKVFQLIKQKPSAFVCFEADIRCCHRGRLAKAASFDTGMEIVHL